MSQRDVFDARVSSALMLLAQRFDLAEVRLDELPGLLRALAARVDNGLGFEPACPEVVVIGNRLHPCVEKVEPHINHKTASGYGWANTDPTGEHDPLEGF